MSAVILLPIVMQSEFIGIQSKDRTVFVKPGQDQYFSAAKPYEDFSAGRTREQINLWASILSQVRENEKVKICEKNNVATPRSVKGGRAGGAPGVGAESLLQAMVRTITQQTFPCNS